MNNESLTDLNWEVHDQYSHVFKWQGFLSVKNMYLQQYSKVLLPDLTWTSLIQYIPLDWACRAQGIVYRGYFGHCLRAVDVSKPACGHACERSGQVGFDPPMPRMLSKFDTKIARADPDN
jgi:hypothetical protein